MTELPDAEQLRQPNYTPPRRLLDALIERFLSSATEPGSVEKQQAITTALRRTAPDALARGLARLPETTGPARALLVALLGRLALDLAPRQPSAVSALLPLIADADPRAARQAVMAAGKLPAEFAPTVEPLLLERFTQATEPADRRALAESLGKLGSLPALPVFRAALDRPGSPMPPVLAQALERAILRIERNLARSPAAPELVASPAPESAPRSEIALDRPLPRPTLVTLRCRAGLTAVVLDELRLHGLLTRRPHSVLEPAGLGEAGTSGEPGRVTLEWSRPLSELFQLRTFSSLAFPLPSPLTAVSDEQLCAEVTDALSAASARELLRTLTHTSGPVRYRLHFADGAHHRSLVWKIATAVRQRAPELLNDPTSSPWQVEIGERDPASTTKPTIELVPQKFIDTRFSYRGRDVPAASHPPLAAALARLAAVGPEDVVWDPFVGSGSELIEVALSGPCQVLYGTDLDDQALSSARENSLAAGIPASRLELFKADALSWRPPAPLTRIITNPPMGRRTRPGQLSTFLSDFLTHAASLLAPGGRLVWISPQPRLTANCATSLGLRQLSVRSVDMNGFWGTLEVWERAPARFFRAPAKRRP